MSRPAVYGEPATQAICIRVTPEQRVALEQVARENSAPLSAVIRDAVDTYVSDYREAKVFRHTESSGGPHNKS